MTRKRIVIWCDEEDYRRFRLAAAVFHTYGDWLKAILDRWVPVDPKEPNIVILQVDKSLGEELEELLSEAKSRGLSQEEAFRLMLSLLRERLQRRGYLY